MAFANRLSFVRFLLALIVSLHGAAASAQSPPPLAQPNVPLVTNGFVHAIVRTPDNRIVVGGDFTEINGVPRSNLARFLADGSLDSAWTPSTNGPVYSLALDADGALFAGGIFNDAGGQNVFCLAKFLPSGDVDSSWLAWTDGPVTAVAVADGAVFISGSFNHVSLQPRARFAKLSTSGVGDVDPTWNPSANSRALALAPGADGTLYAGGAFTTIGGAGQSYLAKLSTSGAGAVDTAWNPAPDDWVNALALDGDTLYAAGRFTTIGGEARNHLARVAADGTGGADAIWDPDVDASAYAVAVGDDDSVFVGGVFGEVDGSPHAGVAKLSADGAGDVISEWDGSVEGRVEAIALDGSGLVYLGGLFADAGGVERHSLARLDATSGLPAEPADATEAGKAFAVAVQSDGGVIVGGRFFAAGGVPRGGLLRLRHDGTLDPDWTPSIGSAINGAAIEVAALAVDASNDVYVGGFFDLFDGESRSNLAKINGVTGALDATWNPSADSEVRTFALDGHGSLFAGGQFTTVGGLARNYIAKLSTSGAGDVDPVWDPSADWYIHTLALDAAGAVYVGGDFSAIGGAPRAFVAKLDGTETGAADPVWNPVPDLPVFSLVPDNAGSVFAGGWFFTMSGESRTGLAKLDAATGAVDPEWDPGNSMAGVAIAAMVLDGDALYVGGSFDELGGIPLASLAKLSTTGVGEPDASFNPGVNGGPNNSEGLLNLTLGNGVLYAGGGFTVIGGEARNGVAAFAVATVLPDSIFADGFDEAP